MRLYFYAFLLVCLARPGVSSGQLFIRDCLHGPSERPGERARREDALQLAAEINRIEALAKRTGQYRPLAELRNLPRTPSGFDVRLFTDGATYILSIIDRLDGCRYAIFSDESGTIYDGYPSSGTVGPRLIEP